MAHLISSDWECWDRKPSAELQYRDEVDRFNKVRTETKVLGSRLGSVVEEVSPESLAKLITSGRTWSPFTFKVCPSWGRRRRIEDLFEQTQILAVDFDDGRSVQDVIDCTKQFGLTFTLLHHSFSSTPEHPKLRGVFFMDERIDSFPNAKLYATGLAYALGGDKVCVDVARIYFGSLPQSMILLNPEQTTSLTLVQSIAKTQSIPKPVQQSKLSVAKSSAWGSPEEQKAIFDDMTRAKKTFLRAKINAVLLDVQNFERGKGQSRYECVWRSTSRLARMPELMGFQVYEWMMHSVQITEAFADWDKDADQVIRSAISWSAKHSDEPL